MRTYRIHHLTEVDEKRFWSKVSLPDADGCMLWLAGIDPTGGYARFKMHGYEGRGSRASLFIAVGPPPSPHSQAAHSCRNRHCVAPDHLRWATPAENQHDKLKDGTHGRGEQNPRAKLSREQVREIRAKKAQGKSDIALGLEYGVSKGLIWYIQKGLIWPDLDEAAS